MNTTFLGTKLRIILHSCSFAALSFYNRYFTKCYIRDLKQQIRLENCEEKVIFAVQKLKFFLDNFII